MALIVGGTLAYFFIPFPWWIVVVVVLAGVEVIEARIWIWAWRERPRSGTEALLGRRGVMSASDRVHIQGTTYPARGEAQEGQEVVVERVDGMTLQVSPAPPRED